MEWGAWNKGGSRTRNVRKGQEEGPVRGGDT